MKMSNDRITRSSGKHSYTCYDYFLCGSLKENELCHKCSNYFNDPNKKLKQHERGLRYACEKPQKVGIQITSINGNHRNRLPAKRKHAALTSIEFTAAGSALTPIDSNTPNSSQPRKKPKHQVVVDHLNGLVRSQSVKLASTVAEKELAIAELRQTKEELSQSLKCNVTIQYKYNDLLSVTKDEVADLNAKLADLEIKNKSLTRQLAKVKQASKKKDYGMRLLRTSISNADEVGAISDPTTACYALIKKLMDEKETPESVVSGIMDALVSRKTFHKHITNYVTSTNFLDTVPSIYQSFHKTIYCSVKDKFKPWVCLRELDLAGTVSLRGFDVIRKIEFSNEESTKYKRGVLCSRSVLSRLARRLERHSEQLIPYVLTENSIKFDVAAALTFILKRYKLWNRVMAPQPDQGKVTVAATCDGGSLAWNLSHVSAGIKLVDPNTVDPRTGDLMFGETGYEKIQSRAACIPLQVHIAKDTKAFYDLHIRSFFDDVNRFEEAHQMGLQVAAPADMCSLVRTVGRGGAMKNARYACYCCNIHRDDLVKPNEVLCVDCVADGSSECYHQEISDEALIDRLHAEADEMLASCAYLGKYPYAASCIRIGSNGVNGNSTRDNRHIEFSPRTPHERIKFMDLLRNELKMRRLDYEGMSLEAMRLTVMEVLLMEERYRLITHVLDASNLEESMIQFEKAVPCLLHLENRISEIIIYHLLLTGWRLREDNNTALEEYITEVQSFVNENLFGTPRCPSNWRFPLKPDGTLDNVKLANWRARRFIDQIDLFVNICFPQDKIEERNQWKATVLLYTETIQVRLFSHYCL
jgi:hypothetical protein